MTSFMPTARALSLMSEAAMFMIERLFAPRITMRGFATFTEIPINMRGFATFGRVQP
jgi:hypothetical protein